MVDAIDARFPDAVLQGARNRLTSATTPANAGDAEREETGKKSL